MKPKFMLSLSIVTLAAVLLYGAPTPAHAAKIKVVTTLTDLADFAREVGGDLVEVHSLATGVEDTHGVPMKPSFVPIMNKADLLILDYDSPTPLARENVAGHAIFGMGSRDVHTVIVNGKIVMEAGSFRWDTAAVYAEAQAEARALWQRMDRLA